MRQDGTSEPRAVATRLNSEPELRFLRSETGGAAQTNAHASSVFRSDASSGLVNTPKQTSALPVSVLYQHKRVVLVQGDSGGFVRQLKRRWVTPEHHPLGRCLSCQRFSGDVDGGPTNPSLENHPRAITSSVREDRTNYQSFRHRGRALLT